MKSKANTEITNVDACREARKFLNIDPKTPLFSKNSKQESFIKNHYCEQDLKYFSPQELSAVASLEVKEINRFLEKRGFDMRLIHNAPVGGCLAASALMVQTNWPKFSTRKEKNIYVSSETSYKGFSLATHGSFAAHAVPGIQSPFFILPTAREDEKIVVVKAGKNQDIEDIEQTYLRFSNSLVTQTSYRENAELFSSLVLPEIELNQEMNLEWMRGLSLDNERFIQEAIQQIKFRLNQDGAVVKAATILNVSGCVGFAPRSEYVFNEPFFLWIIRDGLRYPWFSAYLNYDTFIKVCS